MQNITASMTVMRTIPIRKLHSTIKEIDSVDAHIPLKSISIAKPHRSRSRKRYVRTILNTNGPEIINPQAEAKLANIMCSERILIPDDISVILLLYAPLIIVAGTRSNIRANTPNQVGTQPLNRGGLFFIRIREFHLIQIIRFLLLPSYLRPVYYYPLWINLQNQYEQGCVVESSQSFLPNCRSVPSNTSSP